MRAQLIVHHHGWPDCSDHRTYLMAVLSRAEHPAVVGSILALSRSAAGGLAPELADAPALEPLAEVRALIEAFAADDGIPLVLVHEHVRKAA